MKKSVILITLFIEQSCIIDVKIRTSAKFTRFIDENTGRKESNLNVHHSRQTVCFNVGIFIRKAK